MKRAFVDSHKSNVVDEESRVKLKHQTLLQEYLQLQKEFVSIKRKLKTEKQKRGSLLAEIRFLRRRRKYLLKIRYPKLEEDLAQPQNSDILGEMLEKKSNCSVNEAPLESSYSVLVSNPYTRIEEKEGKEREQLVKEPLGLEKSRNWLIDERNRSVGEKKISWQH